MGNRKHIAALLMALLLAVSLPAPAARAEEPGEDALSLSLRYACAGLFDQYYSPESYYSAPVLCDLEGDGRRELVISSYGLTVLDAETGAVRWQVNAGLDRSSGFSVGANGGGRTISDLAAADLDRDGRLELCYGTAKGTVSVLDSEGYFLPGWPIRLTVSQKEGKGETHPMVNSLRAAALDGDGPLSILVGAGGYASENLYVFNADGSLRPGWPQLSPDHDGSVTRDFTTTGYAMGMLADGLSVGDIDGDGEPEIIAPSDVQFLCAYHTDGTLVAASPAFGAENPNQNLGGTWGGVALFEDPEMELINPNRGWGWFSEGLYVDDRAHLYCAQTGFAGTALRDLDGDGVSEVVCSALMLRSDTLNDYHETKYTTVFAFRGDRSRYYSPARGEDWRTIPSAAAPYKGVGGTCSTLSGPLENSDAYVYGPDHVLSNYVRSNPVVEDLDGDGVYEILFAAYDGYLHCFSLTDAAHEKAGWPYQLPQTGDNVYEYASKPVCADLNGDGSLEVVFASHTDDLAQGLSYDTGVPGRLYVLDAAGRTLVSQELPGGYILYETGKPYCANQCFAAPTVGDADGDGDLEIALNTRFGAACLYDVTVDHVLWAENPFQDVTYTGGSEWYYDYVHEAYDRGLMKGTAADAFSPKGALTLAEAVTMACRVHAAYLGETIDTGGGGAWYAPYFRYAADCGMLQPGEFGGGADPGRVTQPATRAEMAYVFARALPGEALEPVRRVDSLPDVAETDHYGPEIFTLYRAGVLLGSDAQGSFRPGDSILRREAVVLLVRVSEERYRIR